jgi:hypothetical protein
MQRLVRKLFILGVLIGSLIFLASPQSTRADIWGECDAEFIDNAVPACVDTAVTCILYITPCTDPGWGSDCCIHEYNGCLDQGGLDHTACINATDPDPEPYPVIHHFLQWCLQGCHQGCDQLTDPGERFACYMPCSDACFANNPRY